MDLAILRLLGLDPEVVVSVEEVHARGTNRLDRITTNHGAFVLKQTAPNDVEVRCYDLLARLGVPTLTVHARAEHAILLEDLQSIPQRRLATKDDMNRADVGSAVAEWYVSLHTASSELFSDEFRVPSWLRREPDMLNPDVVYETGRKLGLDHLRVWRLAAEQIETLKTALLKMPQVLNYNDFHWSNLALSRQEDTLKAVVFDYGEVGVGPRYSDCRNVIGSLDPDAQAAFWQAYGPVDQIEALLDEPVSDLHALALIHRRTACRRPAEETKGCASESGIMVLKQKTGPRKGAPDRCYHVTTPTASKSPSTTTAWWPMPG